MFDHNYITDNEILGGLKIDPSVPWQKWDWKQAGGWQAYDFARMEDYRNRVVLAYYLYDRISFEHLKREVKNLTKNAPILDAGGGTAKQAIPLAKMGFNNITLLDISEEWLKWAKVKIKKAGVEDNIRIVHGDIKNMSSFKENTFDFSFALGGVISYCRGGEEGLKEIYRVLNPGGRVLFNTHNSLLETITGLKAGNYKQLEEKQEKSKEKPGIAIESFDSDQLAGIVKRIGFTNVNLMSEYFLLPGDGILRTEKTREWEDAIIQKEMELCNDKRLLSSGMLAVTALKPCITGQNLPGQRVNSGSMQPRMWG